MHLMPTPTLQERMSQALAAGYTPEKIIAATKVTGGAVSQWVNGPTKNLSAANALKMALLTGWNVPWWTNGTGPRGQGSPTQDAHGLSYPADILAFQVVEWRSLKMGSLPKTFAVAAPDDSMAPRIRTGHMVEFETGLVPRPGDGVLVSDNEGKPHIRLYVQGRQGQWEAHAGREGYAPLHSGQDGLKLLAVLVGVHARWG